MEIKSAEDILGFKNINSATKLTNKNQQKENVIEDSEPDKIEINIKHTQLRNIANQIKNLETEISLYQVYIEALKKAKQKLISSPDIDTIYRELLNLSENTKFNEKPLLKSIIPQDINFYRSSENIKELGKKIEKERVDSEQVQLSLIKKLNAANIALENIHAMNIELSFKELRNIEFGNLNLHKNLDKQIIISLIKEKINE